MQLHFLYHIMRPSSAMPSLIRTLKSLAGEDDKVIGVLEGVPPRLRGQLVQLWSSLAISEVCHTIIHASLMFTRLCNMPRSKLE